MEAEKLEDEDGGERADLSSADLRRTDLRRTDLRRTDLRHANLRGANLRRTGLGGGRLTTCLLNWQGLNHN